MLEVKEYKSEQAGPHLLVLAGVHGDEVGPVHAAQKLIKDFDANRLILEKGSLTILPLCNPKAYEKGVRFCEANLNRVLCVHEKPKLYEEKIANKILPYIEASDYLLDLHSFDAQGQPFVFQDYESSSFQSFAESMCIPDVLVGWPQMYEGNDNLNAGDTVSFAHQNGKTALAVECGQHLDAQTEKQARQAVLNALSFLSMIKALTRPSVDIKKVRGKEVVVKKKEGSFAQPWKHLERVYKGQLLATYHDGGQLFMPYDGVLLLPKAFADLGQEWFYLGQEL